MKSDLEKRYEAILQATPDIICEVNPQRVYTWMNEAGFNFFGHDAVGREIDFYLCNKREKHTNIQTLLQEREKVFCVQSLHRRRDGEERLLAWWRKVVRGDEGEIVATIYAGRDITERKKAELEKDTLIDSLTIRNRELDALFAFSHLVESALTDLEQIFTGLLGIICEAWQYPKITCCQITYLDRAYQSSNFEVDCFSIKDDLVIHDNQEVGTIEVGYLEEKHFLEEEKELLGTIAQSLSKTIERVEIINAIESEREKLKEANITLKNILDRVEEDKNSIKESIALNIDKSIIPILEELKSDPKSDRSRIARLESNLSDISSDFHKRVVNLKYNLTPTEIEICKMVKAGHPGKQIASMLNISYLTVEGHKRNIRRKLKLNNTKINLQSYLSEMM